MSKLVIRSGVTAAFVSATVDPSATVRGGAEYLYNIWQFILTTPGSGIEYEKELRTINTRSGWKVMPTGNRAVPHRASSPNEPPAPDFFRRNPPIPLLSESLFIEDINGGVRVGSTAWHALFLEYGIGPGFRFPHPANIVVAPRPHASVAMKLASPKMTAGVHAGLRSDPDAVLFELAEINIGDVRRSLLKFSATLGNFSFLGVTRIPGVSALRRGALRGERFLGDFDAFASGRLGQRAAFRAVGRPYGRLIANMTGGIPGKYPRRVANRAVSKYLTSPILKNIFPR